MKSTALKSWLISSSLLLSAVALSACQPKGEGTADSAKPQQVQENTIVAIQAKVVPVKLTKSEACDAEGCMQYDIQTIQSNLKWIDDYFIDRIQKADPIAFSTAPNEKINTAEGAVPNLSQSSTYVRFVDQNYNRATFALQSYSYSAGAAHGMHHQEFVNFDLKSKKR